MVVKSKIGEEANDVNHFARISEDILLAIVSRLENLKQMCQCSLVSKRFASTIYQIKAVSLTLPSSEIPSKASADNIEELFPKLAAFTREEAIRFIQLSSIKEMKFLPSLGNFRELKSISLEFTCSSRLCSASLFKMRVKFNRRGGVVENFVSLVADHVHKVNEQVHDDLQEYGPRKTESISNTFLPFGCCTIWLLALCLLIKCQPSLERISITNGRKQGRLVLEGEQLVAWRNSFIPGGLLHDFMPYSCTRGWVCELYMPATGYLLKGVDFVIAKFMDDSNPESTAAVAVAVAEAEDEDEDDDDDGAVSWEYGGEEKLLEDAVCEYLRKYGDPFMDSEFAY